MNREKLKSEISRRRALILFDIQSISVYALALQSPMEPELNLDKDIEYSMKDEDYAED